MLLHASVIARLSRYHFPLSNIQFAETLVIVTIKTKLVWTTVMTVTLESS